jgi:hypothetical protein
MLDRLATLAYFFRVPVEPVTRLDTVEIAVDIKLQKSRRLIRGPARRLRIDTAETKIKLVNKDVNHANRINLVDPILQAFGKKRRLPATRPSTKRFIRSPQNARAAHFGNRVPAQSENPRRLASALPFDK